MPSWSARCAIHLSAMPSAADMPCHHGQSSAAVAPCHHGQHNARSISALHHLPLMRYAIPVSLLPLLCHAITVSTMWDPSQPPTLFAIPVSTMSYPTSPSSTQGYNHSVQHHYYLATLLCRGAVSRGFALSSRSSCLLTPRSRSLSCPEPFHHLGYDASLFSPPTVPHNRHTHRVGGPQRCLHPSLTISSPKPPCHI